MKKNMIITIIVASVLVVTGIIVFAVKSRNHMEKYERAPLTYGYSALEPYMDAQTVEIHYTKHHQAYVDKLNKALEKHPELFKKPLEELLVHLDEVPEDIRLDVRNQGGGHWAHDFFWKCMTPAHGQLPQGAFKIALEKNFGSIDGFKKAFEAAATAHFASGWCWLVRDGAGNLKIVSTPNHDLPQRDGLSPLLVIDVWEHAYYLKYQNRRGEFINSWWNVVNWPYVEENFNKMASAQN